jgi:CBS domain-containing protein
VGTVDENPAEERRFPGNEQGAEMAQTIRDVMTGDTVSLPASASLVEAAECMKQRNIGDVVVTDGGRACGIVTDRDIVVRAVAENRQADRTTLADVCSKALVTVSPTDTTDHAVRLMREQAVRRLIVMESGNVVGMVSIGDLAVDLDRESALADISAAPPNR